VHVLASAEGTTRQGRGPNTIESKGLHFIPDRILCGNSNPHLPVLTIVSNSAVKAVYLFIYLASNHHRGWLEALTDGNLFKPSTHYPALRAKEAGDGLPVTLPIEIHGAAERSAYARMRLERALHRAIETVPHSIIAMQEVY
jgi:hypothetical protein